MKTKDGKPTVHVKAQLVQDSANTITVFLGHGIKPINFRRSIHSANFEAALRLIAGADRGRLTADTNEGDEPCYAQ